jgi:predicted nucleic acid-binding protein
MAMPPAVLGQVVDWRIAPAPVALARGRLYHQLDDEERQYWEAFFRLVRVLPLSPAVLDEAVALRQQRKMSLGDALVAGTALAHRLTLVTRNVEDFQWIQGLSLLNPFDTAPPQASE